MTTGQVKAGQGALLTDRNSGLLFTVQEHCRSLGLYMLWIWCSESLQEADSSTSQPRLSNQTVWKAFRTNSFSLLCSYRQHLRHWNTGGGYHTDSRVHQQGS